MAVKERGLKRVATPWPLASIYRRRRAGSLAPNPYPLAPTAASLAPKPIGLAMAQGKRKSSDAHTSSRATESFSRAVTHR